MDGMGLIMITRMLMVIDKWLLMIIMLVKVLEKQQETAALKGEGVWD